METKNILEDADHCYLFSIMSNQMKLKWFEYVKLLPKLS